MSALRSDIVTAIREIVPTHAPRSSERWNAVLQISDVSGVKIRNYFVELSDVEETGEVYGGCLLHTAQLRIWTGYTGLSPADAQVICLSDGVDLWAALHRAEIQGAPKFEKQPFESLDDEDGDLFGAHVFLAFFFLPLP